MTIAQVISIHAFPRLIPSSICHLNTVILVKKYLRKMGFTCIAVNPVPSRAILA
jgi:hypothetical protein